MLSFLREADREDGRPGPLCPENSGFHLDTGRPSFILFCL
jgi:hypothetical protein